MPEISRFLGIIIQMFFNDHNPSHFHADYGNDSAALDIATLKILEGHLPPQDPGIGRRMGITTPGRTDEQLE